MDIADVAELASAAFEADAWSHRADRLHLTAQLPPEDGTVRCIDCAEPIPPERLAVLPHACRCVDCQAVAER